MSIQKELWRVGMMHHGLEQQRLEVKKHESQAILATYICMTLALLLASSVILSYLVLPAQ